MLRKLALFLSLLLPLNVAIAQETPQGPNFGPSDISPTGSMIINLSCYNFLELKQKVEKDHEEIPFLSSEGVSVTMNMVIKQFQMAPHKMYIFANPKTYNYTLVFRMNDQIGCIVSSGGNMGPVIQETPL